MAKKLARPAAAPVARGFRTVVYSRHPSHRPLRTMLPRLPFRSFIRLGSTTVPENDGNRRIELNSVESIRNASDKRRMKRRFSENNVPTAAWVASEAAIPATWWADGGKVVMKHAFGSRGRGLHLISRAADIARHYHSPANEYIFEKYHDYSREYRLHVTKDGCFMAWRKVLREDTPQDQRWIRNDATCNWVGVNHQLFDRPSNWAQIEAACVSALRSVGLDIGGCDVKVQSANDSRGRRRATPAFIILEINSACSHAEQTRAAYITQIPRLLREKAQR